jgi:copper chaperone CopZ
MHVVNFVVQKSEMKTEKIIIANLKCGGCANTIITKLASIKGVKEVMVEQDANLVTILYEGEVARTLFTKKLKDLGYPEATAANGLLTQLKSYASCAVGRMTKKKTFPKSLST